MPTALARPQMLSSHAVVALLALVVVGLAVGHADLEEPHGGIAAGVSASGATAPFASSAAVDDDGEAGHTYEVQFDTTEPLGMQLDDAKRVIRFWRQKSGQMGHAEKSGWIQTGDRLVAINAMAVKRDEPLTQVLQRLQRASVPKILQFHTRKHDSRFLDVQRDEFNKWQTVKAEGKLKLTTHDIPLGNASFVQALFGGPPSCTPQQLVLADPPHACGEVKNAAALQKHVALVVRGDCAFVDKAINVQSAGAAGMLLLNDAGVAFRMKPTDYERDEVKIPVSMVGEDDSRLITNLLQHHAVLHGEFRHPDQWCVETRNVTGFNKTHPAALKPNHNITKVQETAEYASGHVLLRASDSAAGVVGEDKSFEYLRAKFGLEPTRSAVVQLDPYAAFKAKNYKIPDALVPEEKLQEEDDAAHGLTAPIALVIAQPLDGCAPLNVGRLSNHSAVLVERGGCSFDVKQAHVAASGARLMIVTNDRVGLFHMMPATKHPGDLPAVLVTQSAGDYLRSTVQAAGQAHVHIRLQGDARLQHLWADLQDLLDRPEAWPQDMSRRRKLFFRLSRLHHPSRDGGSVERFQVLEHAFAGGGRDSDSNTD